jgi:hypothetical protein
MVLQFRGYLARNRKGATWAPAIAERAGFEPARVLPLRDFQSRALDQLCDLSFNSHQYATKLYHRRADLATDINPRLPADCHAVAPWLTAANKHPAGVAQDNLTAAVMLACGFFPGQQVVAPVA